MLNARRNLICTAAHADKSLVPAPSTKWYSRGIRGLSLGGSQMDRTPRAIPASHQWVATTLHVADIDRRKAGREAASHISHVRAQDSETRLTIG
jgi:hypothetical protein